jgi:hypothetical protein
VSFTDDGLEAVVFTADGDMRQALNNLQATHSGFGLVNQDNVFKVRVVCVGASGRVLLVYAPWMSVVGG